MTADAEYLQRLFINATASRLTGLTSSSLPRQHVVFDVAAAYTNALSRQEYLDGPMWDK